MPCLGHIGPYPLWYIPEGHKHLEILWPFFEGQRTLRTGTCVPKGILLLGVIAPWGHIGPYPLWYNPTLRVTNT